MCSARVCSGGSLRCVACQTSSEAVLLLVLVAALCCGARPPWLARKDVRAARAPEHGRCAAQDEEPAAVAEVKGVAADAVADYLRSADVYQVHAHVTAPWRLPLCLARARRGRGGAHAAYPPLVWMAEQ